MLYCTLSRACVHRIRSCVCVCARPCVRITCDRLSAWWWWWDENQYLFVKIYEPVVRAAQIAGPYTYRLPISQQFGASRLLLALNTLLQQ